MAIDSHMHINSYVLKNVKDYIEKINNNDNIESVINVGLDFKTSMESIEISNANSKFYSSVGIHPLYVNNQNINDLYSIIENKRVVAIGEIGLDNSKNNFDIQRNI